MKALRDAKWVVYIKDACESCYWEAVTKNVTGMDMDAITAKGFYKTTRGAVINWKKFASINDFKNYTLDLRWAGK